MEERMSQQYDAKLLAERQHMETARLDEEQKFRDSVAKLQTQVSSFQAEKDLALQKQAGKFQSEIQELKAQVALLHVESDRAVTSAVAAERDASSQRAQEDAKERERLLLKLDSMKSSYEEKLSVKDEQIAYYRDFKAKLSTKMIGESLERYCEQEFERLRAVGFSGVYFEKDNDARTGSKGDYIYREQAPDGTEILSIMFEMKNQNDETATKHKNVDFFKKTAEEKFRSCDQGIQEVVKKFTVDHSYLDIVPGVAEMVRQRLGVYANKGVNDGAKKAFHKEKSDRHLKDNSLFTNNIANVAGNDVKYTRHVEIPQWSLDLHECLTDGDKANNFDQVRIKITEELVNYFGGFRRMQRIYVVSYQLIINDVCYVPRLSKQVLARLPFDCADYITNGNLAPFFDWSYIFKMNNLHLLSFDDMDFVTTYVADDIGMGRDFKPVLLFKHCKNLSTLCIGSDVIRYPLPEDEIENQQVQEAVEHMEYKAHQNTYFYDKCEKYYNATFNSTKAVRQWGVGNLVNYAQNRGDKGVLRYTGGLAVRTAVATGLAIPEAVTRVTGGLIGGIKSTLKSARQATSNQDITNNGGNM